MTLEVHLRDKSTGKTGVYYEKYPDGYDLKDIDFMWSKGNYACDCNRSLFLYRARGEDHPDESDYMDVSPFLHYPCNGEKIVVERAIIKETGVVMCELNDDNEEVWMHW